MYIYFRGNNVKGWQNKLIFFVQLPFISKVVSSTQYLIENYGFNLLGSFWILCGVLLSNLNYVSNNKNWWQNSEPSQEYKLEIILLIRTKIKHGGCWLSCWWNTKLDIMDFLLMFFNKYWNTRNCKKEASKASTNHN